MFRCLIPGILAMTMLTFSAAAQTATGILQGRVTDASGAAVVDSKVTIENQRTGVKQTLATNIDGVFVQTYLIPSEYKVAAEKPGFQTFQTSDVRINVQQTVQLDISLKVGEVGTTVEVTANTVQLATSTSTVSTVMNRQAILDLPLNGRNPFNLASLTPGVTGNGNSRSISGGRGATNEITIDGTTVVVPENNVSTNDQGYEPIVDSIEEFSVITNSLSAEYGRTGGGVINVATRSGSNEFHGSLFEFLRNEKLDANSWGNNRNGARKNPLRRNQFGGSIGGPISLPKLYDGKNRTFFFFSEQSTIVRNAASGNATVPTAAWKAGNFADLRNGNGAPITLFDPANVVCTAACDSANPTFQRQAFPGNIVPTERIDPVAKNMLKFYPDPTPGAPVLNQFTQQNNYFNQGSSKNNEHKFDSRVDHNFAERFRIWVRGSYGRNVSTPFNLYNNLGTTGDGPNTSISYNVALNSVYTFNPTTILNFNYGLTRRVFIRDPFSQGIDLRTLGFSESVYATAAAQNLEFPRINMGGNQNISNLGQSTFTALRIQGYDHEMRSDLTKVFTRHTVKAGGQFRKLLMNFRQNGQPSGEYQFNNSLWTQQNVNNNTSTTQGMGFANFLLGLPNASLGGATNSGGTIEHTFASAQASDYIGFYAQDDWKVSRKLTLNMGLRWDVDVPRTERYNRLSFFDVNAQSPIAGAVPGLQGRPLFGAMNFVSADNRRQTPTDNNNWGPRFGFAFQLNNKTVFRGAYGLTYGGSVMQAAGTSGSSGTLGFSSSTGMNSSFDGRTPVATLSNPFPGGFNLPLGRTDGPTSGRSTNLGLSVGGGDGTVFLDYQSPIIQQWNATLQRELPGGFLVEAGYIASKGNHLLENESGGAGLNQLPFSFAALGTQLQATVSNPFFGVITNPTSNLSRATVSYNQLLRPYPHYTGVDAYRKPGGNSIYHAMTLRVEKRYSHGLNLLVAFTGGKSIDDSSSQPQGGGGNATKQDLYNRAGDRSVSAFDVSRRLVISSNYELPFGKNRMFLSNAPKAIDLALGGWQVNTIFTLQRGTPLIFTTGTPNNTFLFSPGQRLNSTGVSAKKEGPISERLNAAFDTTAFTLPANFAFGNMARISPDIRGNHTNNIDLSVFKDFMLRETVRLRFQAEAFSFANHPIWANPGTTFNTVGTFGIIQTKNSNTRQMHLALRLNF